MGKNRAGNGWQQGTGRRLTGALLKFYLNTRSGKAVNNMESKHTNGNYLKKGKMKNIIIITLVFGILLILMPSCTLKTETPEATTLPGGTADITTQPLSDIPTEPPSLPPEIIMTTDKPWYLSGEVIDIEFAWENYTSKPMTIAPFPYEVDIWNVDRNLVWISTIGSGKNILAEGEIVKHRITWDQRDSMGRYVEPGYYFIYFKQFAWEGKLFPGYTPYKILVQYPQGSIDKKIEIKETKQLEDGSRLVLDECVLSSTGARVVATVFPLNFNGPLSDRERSYYTTVSGPARYKTDNGILSSPRYPKNNYQKDRVILEWDLFNPVPNGTKTLDFIMDEIKWRRALPKQPQEVREWTGPFEFNIEIEK